SVLATYAATAINYYTVTFMVDGSSYDEQTVREGYSATTPAIPTKASTAEFDYAFNAWDVDYTNITADLTVNAEFLATLRYYNVTFVDEDGTTVLGTDNVAYGSGATAPDNPFKEADETNAYAFAGWDVPFDYIVGALTVTATYDTLPLNTTFEVNFYDTNGDIISSQEVLIGEDAVAPADPVKAPDVQYTYTFAGWDISFTNVQSALNVTAVYTTTLNQYTVTFYDFDGTTILSQGLVDYGTAATPPANPIKPDDTEWRYTFIGWNSGYNFITGDLELIPLFFKTSLSVFDRQALVDLVIEMFDAGDPDAVILMMQNVFSPGGTEEDLYNKLMAVQRLMVDLKGISNAGDLQNWLNEINLLGFDRTTMIDTLYSLSILGLQMNIQDMQDQILEKEGYIDDEYTN
ncbi:MAG TPA: InlB B-repeat-containing protein, partial [Bacillota bacterium]|nr:InlB B-repeat-containing protein [Bacillota bacterium]